MINLYIYQLLDGTMGMLLCEECLQYQELFIFQTLQWYKIFKTSKYFL